ncbi:NADH ubiquinone oxidoreductase chain A [hydrothermal vent metagenome]|uniref:NADH ubiquinone oxidoreductase chain A n=1 Tax=hydrothermal vent metagenome TaxID=652676 RepID=A0A1W1EBI0_9ZZZZ
MSDSLILASFMIAALVIILPLAFHLTKYLGSSSDNIRKNEVVEGGIRNVHKDSFEGFNVKFFLIGIIFLIFDVEILFMFPWALNLRELGMFALIEMFVFITILFAGLIYVYKSGILKWS